LTLKIKHPDFTLLTRSKTLEHAVTTVPAAVEVLDELLTKLSEEGDLDAGVRLLGVSVRNFDHEAEQLSLFGTGLEEAWSPATRAIDEIRERFGARAIRPASALGENPLPGEAAWGPSQTDRSD
jgi:DNA polymerase-4